jgi:hypothetical protein
MSQATAVFKVGDIGLCSNMSNPNESAKNCFINEGIGLNAVGFSKVVYFLILLERGGEAGGPADGRAEINSNLICIKYSGSVKIIFADLYLIYLLNVSSYVLLILTSLVASYLSNVLLIYY